MTTFTPAAKQAGDMIVTLSEVRPGVWRVETTNSSGFVVDAWSRSYSDLDMARMAATHAWLAFREFGNDATIDRLDRETRAILAEQDRRTRRGMHNPAVVAEATALLDRIANLTDLALLVELRTTLAA